MTDTMLLIFEIIGTAAFAVSGAMTGIKKKMDIFGVVILGIVTAVGGGMIRDIILGITPPAMFRDPKYTAVAAAASIIIFLPSVRSFFEKQGHVYEAVLLWMDSVGLAAFTVAGIQVSHTAGCGENVFLTVFVGVVTGIGGGVLRDVFSGDVPGIFVKHFYACASIAGAVCCSVLWNILPMGTAMAVGGAVTLMLRLFAAHFRWSLPKPE